MNEDTDSERRFFETVHNLRTPLNQIIGFSEMLTELAEERRQQALVEGLASVRAAGLELGEILHDNRLFVSGNPAGRGCVALDDAARVPIGRVLGFVDILLGESENSQIDDYRPDLTIIRTAAQHFLSLARVSGLFVGEQSERRSEQAYSLEGATEERANAAGGRILIVDDENLNREVLARRLQREGYRSCDVASGFEALELLQREPFDAILLDIVMPEMSGIEVLQAIKQDAGLRHLPVIMLSAFTEVERVVRCIELGAEDYLPKPINAVLLRARLGACLEKKRLRDQEQEHFEALHAEKEQLSVMLRSLADAVVTTDTSGAIVLFNETAAAFTGMSSGAARGRPFIDVFPLRSRETGELLPNIGVDALTQNTVVEREPGIALRFPDGSERVVSVRSAPIHDQDGTVSGIVVVVRDITEKEKMAEELLRASKLQSIGVLAGGLAHDFNNMLTAVLGNLSLLRHRQNLPLEILSGLQEAEEGALRAQELTRYLLTFSQGGEPMKQRVQVRTLIESTAAFALRGSHVQCDFQLPSDLWDTEADPNQLAQVISNVMLNAIEASPPGGSIMVLAKNVTAPLLTAPNLAPGDYLRVTIQDRGAGIAPDHLGRIYDPFFTTKKQARGLGLAAAYSIIQRHGGYISVESTPRVGTEVTFFVPALRETETSGKLVQFERSGRPAAVSDAAPRKLRALVMDDEESIRYVVKAMLETLGFEVATAVDGEAALTLHGDAAEAGTPFDVAIMDLTIPGGLGGKETIRRLREKDTKIRAIVSSGYSNDPVMARYVEYGFDGVLPKPYMMKDLMAALTQLSLA